MRWALGGVAAVIAVVLLAAVAMFGTVLGGGALAPAPVAVAGIPADYLTLYTRAALTCPGLHWSVLAAVGKVETDHARVRLPGVTSGENYAGAGGPMQFLGPTFDAVIADHPPPPGGADPPSRYNPHDAIHTAAAYLCDNGARHSEDIRAALFTYNHSTTYVTQVLDIAHRYAQTAQPTPHATDHTATDHTATAHTAATRTAITYALAQLGRPYLWGGDGPDRGETGFDCSGLTTAAYAAAGLQLPRTAHTQYHAGPPVPPGHPLQPGDLVFFGDPTVKITHVALYLGRGHVVHAPRRGQPVQIAALDSIARYVGATRPATTRWLCSAELTAVARWCRPHRGGGRGRCS